MVGIGKRHHPDGLLMRQLNGTLHTAIGVQIPAAAMTVPALQHSQCGLPLCLGVHIHRAVLDAFDELGKAIKTMGINAVPAGIGKQCGRKLRPFTGNAVFVQYADKLAAHDVIGNSHVFFLLFRYIRIC